MYIRVGIIGNSDTKIIDFISLDKIFPDDPKQCLFLNVIMWIKTGMTGSQTIPMTTNP